MPDLIPFDYSGRQVRTVTIDGEPWFVAGDVCAVLGLTNVTAALQRLDPASFTQTEVPNANGHLRPTYVVDESGLYELIIRSTYATPKGLDYVRKVVASLGYERPSVTV